MQQSIIEEDPHKQFVFEEALVKQEEHLSRGVRVPIEVNGTEGAFWVRVRPAQNQQFKDRLRGLERRECARRRKKRMEDLTAEDQEKISYESMFDTIATEWGDIDLDWNIKNWMQVCQKLVDVGNQVMGFATAAETFDARYQERVELN